MIEVQEVATKASEILRIVLEMGDIHCTPFRESLAWRMVTTSTGKVLHQEGKWPPSMVHSHRIEWTNFMVQLIEVEDLEEGMIQHILRRIESQTRLGRLSQMAANEILAIDGNAARERFYRV